LPAAAAISAAPVSAAAISAATVATTTGRYDDDGRSTLLRREYVQDHGRGERGGGGTRSFEG